MTLLRKRKGKVSGFEYGAFKWIWIWRLYCSTSHSRRSGTDHSFWVLPANYTVRTYSRACVSPYFNDTMSVCRTVSEILSVKEWRDLETGGRGRSRSSKMAPLDRYTTFYWFSINISHYLTNDAIYSHSYYGRRTGNRTQSLEWYRFEWSWVTSNQDFKVMILFNVK